MLEINTSNALADFSENEKGIKQIYTLGGQQEMTEDGLYQLIFRSDKPAGLDARSWFE